jgi:transcription-repair coupling factor (superfamily II helicase)
LAEKVIDRSSLEKNTLEISVNNKLSIDFITEFLVEYDFDRVDFVYEPGQFSVRGGIVDIFSFSHMLPYRVEFFGDIIESIRTFEIESQLSVEQVKSITIVPNVQSKFLTENNISLLRICGARYAGMDKGCAVYAGYYPNRAQKSHPALESPIRR